jgi:DNA mismatch repair ATPase MutL
VCALTLVTRAAESEMATQIDFADGQLPRNMSKTAANQGTSISVRKLFANVPRRRKLSQSDQVELRHI